MASNGVPAAFTVSQRDSRGASVARARRLSTRPQCGAPLAVSVSRWSHGPSYRSAGPGTSHVLDVVCETLREEIEGAAQFVRLARRASDH